jgi:beta-lactamase regulating signal transducer with metallopeptidase domain
MAPLTSWYPGAWAVEFISQVTVAVALISLIGIVFAACCPHHPAARHFVLLSALICALVSPALAAAFLASRISPIVVPFITHPEVFSLASSRDDLNLHPKSNPAFPGHGLDHAMVRVVDSREAVGAFTEPAAPISQRSRISSQVISSRAVAESGDMWNGRVRQSVTVAMLVWAMGSLFLVLRMGRSWSRLLVINRSLRFQTAQTMVDILEDARRAVGGRSLSRLAVSDRVRTPIATGLLHPVIVLPSELLTALGPVELRDVLVHELAHIIRRDQIVILLQAVAQAAYWPIWPIHWLNRRLANAREEVCDNYVLAQQHAVSYGETLLRVAAMSRNRVTCSTSAGMLGWRGRLEERITELIHERRNISTRVKPLGAASILAVLAVATGGLCATTIVSAQTEFTPSKSDAGAIHRSMATGNAQSRVETDDVRAQASALHAPGTGAERAVVSLVLVFCQDRARRAIDGVMVNAGDHTLIFTTSSACVVPEGIPPAIDSAFLERRGKPAVDALYDPRSNAEIFVYRTVGGLTSYQFADSPTVGVGDALDAITSKGPGEMRVISHAATVRATDREAEVNISGGVVHHFKSLLQIDRGFPEGTPFFKDGKFVGMTVVGTRFLHNDPNRCYLVPVERMAALDRTIKNAERGALKVSGNEAARPLTPAASEFPYAVGFDQGATRFLNGDKISIQEVRGTADMFTPGNIYWIKGTYTLASRDRAILLASITVTDWAEIMRPLDLAVRSDSIDPSKATGAVPGRATGVELKVQRTVVNRGTGTFTLFLPMSYRGLPHVSFYSFENGEGFGGNYFGTGNSVLNQWWGSKETDRKATSAPTGSSNIENAKDPHTQPVPPRSKGE